jgi:hypothetical protein
MQKLWIRSKASHIIEILASRIQNPKLLISIIAFLGFWILINIVMMITTK